MWARLKKLVKPNGAIVLFGSQPFTSALIMSNPEWFKYCWIWNKVSGVGFQSVKIMPLKSHEDICVFGSKKIDYFPQKSKGKPYNRPRSIGGGYMGDATAKKFSGWITKSNGDKYPKSILQFSNANQTNKLHPTQKPVNLMEYLIKTYTLPGETVLDFTMGSGSTGVAAKKLGRKFIGIELDTDYFEIAKNRINEVWAPGQTEPSDKKPITEKEQLDIWDALAS